MKDAMPVIRDVAEKFEEMTGRSYGFFEEYRMDDAEVALVVIGSSAGTGKEAVDRLRAEGKKVGLIKLKMCIRDRRETAILPGLYSSFLFFIISRTRTQITVIPPQMIPKPCCIWDRGIQRPSTFMP